MDFVEVNGTALRYELSGSGPSTLVLIHEMGGTLESWDLFVPLLSSKRRILRYDTRGAGLSLERERFMDLFNFEDQTEGVKAFLEKRKPEWKNA